MGVRRGVKRPAADSLDGAMNDSCAERRPPVPWAQPAARRKRRRTAVEAEADAEALDPSLYSEASSSSVLSALATLDCDDDDSGSGCSGGSHVVVVEVLEAAARRNAAALLEVERRMTVDIGSSEPLRGAAGKRVAVAVDQTHGCIVGCLVFERVASARRMVRPEESAQELRLVKKIVAAYKKQHGADARPSPEEIGKAIDAQAAQDRLGAARAETTRLGPPQEGWELDNHVESLHQLGTGCLCGVSRVWVDGAARRRGVAAKMIHAARAMLVYGYEVPLEQVAFSQPSAEGKLLARAITQRDDFFVYAPA